MSLGAYLIYFAILLILPLWAQMKVRNAYNKYSSKVPTSSQMRGVDVARKILDENELYDVRIEEVQGTLTDHYDPRSKTVRLSTNNYHGTSMAAAAVAAHEVGHALQDAEEYALLKFRTSLVPLASFGSGASFYISWRACYSTGWNCCCSELSSWLLPCCSSSLHFRLNSTLSKSNASTRRRWHHYELGRARHEKSVGRGRIDVRCISPRSSG